MRLARGSGSDFQATIHLVARTMAATAPDAGCSLSLTPTPGLQTRGSLSGALMGVRDPDSGPQAFPATTLVTEPSPKGLVLVCCLLLW